jgi:aminopeptidase N
VAVQGDTQLTQIKVNIDKPVAAFLINAGDHTYAKVRFDPKSIQAFKMNMHKIKDPLSRMMIWE